MENYTCPLCEGNHIDFFSEDKVRKYYQCGTCALIFVSEEELLKPEIEKSRYDFHENNPEDAGYRKFLNRLLDPFSKYIKDFKTGIDFGCGPGPAISVYLGEEGYEITNYDPFYCKNDEALNNKYDFLTSTEAIEHMFDPKKEFERMLSLVKDGGVLGIMTQFSKPKEEFPNWWYLKDDTHVRFFSPETFSWMANKYNLDVNFYATSVAIFKKR